MVVVTLPWKYFEIEGPKQKTTDKASKKISDFAKFYFNRFYGKLNSSTNGLVKNTATPHILLVNTLEVGIVIRCFNPVS